MTEDRRAGAANRADLRRPGRAGLRRLDERGGAAALAPRQPDWETPTAEVDLRVGGKIRDRDARPPTGPRPARAASTRVVDPPHRLVFTWILDDQPIEPQLIELEFSERDGRTTVLMTNSAIPTDGRLESQERGWQVCYDNLERLLAG